MQAAAFYVDIVAAQPGKVTSGDQDLWVDMSVQIAAIVSRYAIRDWAQNPDAQLEIENAIEDFLLEYQNAGGIQLNYSQIDDILARCMRTTRRFY